MVAQSMECSKGKRRKREIKGDIMEEENVKAQPVRIEGVWKYRYCPYEKRVYLVYRITDIIPMDEP